MKTRVAVGVVLVGLVVVAGWLGYRGAIRSPGPATQPPAHLEINTIPVTRGDVRQVLVVPGEVVTSLRRGLGFPVGGRLAELSVHPGDTVTRGQTLARLETEPLEQAVKRAQEDLAAKRAALEKLRAGSSFDLVVALADLLGIAIDVVTAEAGLARLKMVLVAVSQLTRLLAVVDRSGDIDQAEAAVRMAEQALKEAKSNLEAATLVAPFDGTVLEVKAQPGDWVSANTPLIELADLTQLEVRTTVAQEDIMAVHPGQEAVLTFDVLPEETFPGRVKRVIPKKTEGQVVTYEVFIALEGRPAGLLPGMTADVEIVLAEHKDVLVLPRRAIHARPYTTVSVPVLVGDQVVTRSVQIGLVGDLNAEILSGLQEGDRVVVKQ